MRLGVHGLGENPSAQRQFQRLQIADIALASDLRSKRLADQPGGVLHTSQDNLGGKEYSA